MALVDIMLIIACVTEFSIFNIFWGSQPNWYILAFPYFIHPFKVCVFLHFNFKVVLTQNVGTTTYKMDILVPTLFNPLHFNLFS